MRMVSPHGRDSCKQWRALLKAPFAILHQRLFASVRPYIVFRKSTVCCEYCKRLQLITSRTSSSVKRSTCWVTILHRPLAANSNNQDLRCPRRRDIGVQLILTN